MSKWKFVLLALIAADGAGAAPYSYHPASILSLGSGLSPNNLSSAKGNCLVFAKRPTDTGAIQTQFDSFLIHDASSVSEIMGIDSSIDASYLSYKADARFNLKTDTFDARDSITLVIRGTSLFGRYVMENPSLTLEAQKILESGDHERFERACGSEYVSLERRGAMVAVFITLENINSTVKRDMTGGFHGGGGFGPVSANVRASFENHLTQAATRGSVRVQVASTGGEGFGGLGTLVSELATQKESLSKIEAEVGKYISQFKFDNAAPIGFETSTMEYFGYDPDRVSIWNERKRGKLRRLVDEYRRQEAVLRDIHGILEGKDPRRNLIGGQELKSLDCAKTEIEKRQDQIADRHESCMDRKTSLEACELPPPILTTYSIPPRPPLPKLILSRRAAPIDFLEVEGYSMETIEILLNDERVSTESVDSWAGGDLAKIQRVTISLEPYWTLRKGFLKGVATGTIRIHDAYGSIHSRTFHRALHRADSSEDSIYDQFSAKGDL